MSKAKNFGRRGVLKGATATAALLTAARAALPAGAFAQAAGPETKSVKLGFIALTDAAPLIVAKEKKIFDKYGITDAEVAKQASWGTTRDNMVLGSAAGGIDGAHILTPFPYLISLGTVTSENKPTPMYILARLNCQGISVSNEFKSTGAKADAAPLKEAFAKKKAAGKEVKCAMTFPGGTHDMWIRYWLAAGGIDPDKDVSTIVVPPAQMVANMKVGNMDAFCVGEPWNDQLVHQDIGYTACTTGEVWKDHPEKACAFDAIELLRDPSHQHALTAAQLRALGAEVGLTEISMRTYGTELPIEVVLATSFPPEGMLDHVRSLFRRDAESGLDAFGMNARLKDGAVWATYPMTVVVWARYPHKETAADRGDQRPELEVSLKPPA